MPDQCFGVQVHQRGFLCLICYLLEQKLSGWQLNIIEPSPSMVAQLQKEGMHLRYSLVVECKNEEGTSDAPLVLVADLAKNEVTKI